VFRLVNVVALAMAGIVVGTAPLLHAQTVADFYKGKTI